MVVIGAQLDPDGHLLETPGMQDTDGPGVAMHWPLQPRWESGKQNSEVATTHVEPVGQGVPAPLIAMQGTNDGVYTDRQSPPQVIVCVQIAPAGHTLTPPTIPGVGVLVTVGLVIILWCQ